MNAEFRQGIRHGIPIALGYLSVSFAFGMKAAGDGLTVLQAVLISMTNLTSAGQIAALPLMVGGASLTEMALTQLTINLRYALMSLSLSQKLDQSFTLPHRLIAAYGITDEIFALASTREEPIKPAYMYGLIFTPFLGWSLGTLLGATAGNLLPIQVTAAMSLMLYGMFIAIIIPPAKKNRRILFVVLLSACFSVLLKFLLPMIGDGFAVIIAALLSSVITALLFPVESKEAPQ